MSDQELDDARKSRRRILKAAAATGVGIGAFGAPGVSVVPAYGLTNSKVNDICFYFTWEDGEWEDDDDSTNADSISVDDDDRIYTWGDPTGKGLGPLVIRASGDPSGAGATISATSLPTGCSLIVPAKTGGSPYSETPGNGGEPCTLNGSAQPGTYSTTSFTTTGDDDTYVLIFDLSC